MADIDWRAELHRAGAAVHAANAASDSAFARLDAMIRAARRAGRTGAELMELSGLSKARVDEAIAGDGDAVELKHGVTDVRIAAYAAAAEVAGWLAARGRRDALMLEAGVASPLRYSEIAKAAGTSRRYEWELRTGKVGLDRRSPRQDVFEGAGIAAYRDTENARLRRRYHDERPTSRYYQKRRPTTKG